MKLKNLVQTLDSMSDDELRERLRQIRHNRSVEKPAAKAHKERAEKKATRKATNAIDKMIAGLSPEEIADLLRQLEE